MAELVEHSAEDGEVGSGHHGDHLGHLSVDVGGLIKLGLEYQKNRYFTIGIWCGLIQLGMLILH